MSILVIADIKDKIVNPASLELITAAHLLQKITELPIYFIVPFSDVEYNHIRSTSYQTIVIDSLIAHYLPKTLAHTISKTAMSKNAKFILGLHTPFSIDFLPSIGIAYDSLCFTQVNKITINTSIIITRNSHFGKLDQEIDIEKTPICLSIIPGSFEEDIPSCNGNVEYILPIEFDTNACQFITQENKDTGLDEADVIIGVGKGIGAKENLEIIYNFAKHFSHSAVAGSRIVCDLGWLPYSKQIGITGKSINPKIYIACAISGSSQHIVGIKGSKTIIAINKDPYAPIFNVAHYGIVADIFEFLPEFINFMRSIN